MDYQEARDVLFFHLMNLTSTIHENGGTYDDYQLEEALRIAIDIIEKNMER